MMKLTNNEPNYLQAPVVVTNVVNANLSVNQVRHRLSLQKKKLICPLLLQW